MNENTVFSSSTSLKLQRIATVFIDVAADRSTSQNLGQPLCDSSLTELTRNPQFKWNLSGKLRPTKFNWNQLEIEAEPASHIECARFMRSSAEDYLQTSGILRSGDLR